MNNPLNKNGPSPAPGQFPLLGSQQIAGSGSATGNPRNKVGLAKGFGLMDWIRLSKSGKDLTGVGGPFVKGKIREVSKQVVEILDFVRDLNLTIGAEKTPEEE